MVEENKDIRYKKLIQFNTNDIIISSNFEQYNNNEKENSTKVNKPHTTRKKEALSYNYLNENNGIKSTVKNTDVNPLGFDTEKIDIYIYNIPDNITSENDLKQLNLKFNSSLVINNTSEIDIILRIRTNKKELYAVSPAFCFLGKNSLIDIKILYYLKSLKEDYTKHKFKIEALHIKNIKSIINKELEIYNNNNNNDDDNNNNNSNNNSTNFNDYIPDINNNSLKLIDKNNLDNTIINNNNNSNNFKSTAKKRRLKKITTSFCVKYLPKVSEIIKNLFTEYDSYLNNDDNNKLLDIEDRKYMYYEAVKYVAFYYKKSLYNIEVFDINKQLDVIEENKKNANRMSVINNENYKSNYNLDSTSSYKQKVFINKKSVLKSSFSNKALYKPSNMKVKSSLKEKPSYNFNNTNSMYYDIHNTSNINIARKISKDELNMILKSKLNKEYMNKSSKKNNLKLALKKMNNLEKLNEYNIDTENNITNNNFSIKEEKDIFKFNSNNSFNYILNEKTNSHNLNYLTTNNEYDCKNIGIYNIVPFEILEDINELKYYYLNSIETFKAIEVYYSNLCNQLTYYTNIINEKKKKLNLLNNKEKENQNQNISNKSILYGVNKRYIVIFLFSLILAILTNI